MTRCSPLREAEAESDAHGRYAHAHVARATLRYQRRAEGFLPRRLQLALTDADGRARVRGVPDLTVKLEIGSRKYAETDAGARAGFPGEAGDELDLGPLEPPAPVAVTFLPDPVDAGVDATPERVATYEVAGVLPELRAVEVGVHARSTVQLLPGSYPARLVRARGAVQAIFDVWPEEPLELDLATALAESGAW